MAELKHTDFMRGLKKLIVAELPDDWHDFHFGETKWLFQIYYGREKRIHYEVTRNYAQQGRMLEIGLHFESQDKDVNSALLAQFQKYIWEIRAELGEQVVAEQWDRGWTKVYEAYPSEALTEDVQQFTAERLAKFILTMQPIYEELRQK